MWTVVTCENHTTNALNGKVKDRRSWTFKAKLWKSRLVKNDRTSRVRLCSVAVLLGLLDRSSGWYATSRHAVPCRSVDDERGSVISHPYVGGWPRPQNNSIAVTDDMTPKGKRLEFAITWRIMSVHPLCRHSSLHFEITRIIKLRIDASAATRCKLPSQDENNETRARVRFHFLRS